MSLSNITQVLLRNHAFLVAHSPLFVNLTDDGFVEHYLQENPKANISCYHNNYIDYSAISAKSNPQVTALFSSEYTSELLHDLVIINFPKSKDELAFTLAMVAPFLQADCKVVLVGEKKGGVQSSPKLVNDWLTSCQKIDAARHCLLFAGIFNAEKSQQPFVIDDWYKTYQLNIDNIELTIASLPGVFSQKKLDVGTALLLANLPESMQGKVLDFGCGAGVISSFVGKKHPHTTLSLLDVSALALASAKKTLALNGLSGEVFASNSLSKVSNQYQHVISNPPFHQGTKTSYRASEDFLRGIKPFMSKGSDISIVANSFLQYLPIMKQHIGSTQTLVTRQGFSIYYCYKS